MKFSNICTIWGVLIVALLFAGCTSISPNDQTTTPVPTTIIMPTSPTPTAIPARIPYPNALPLNEYAAFGSGSETGKATVLRYDIKPNYTWTSPSWNSAAEQAASSKPLDIQRGYNMATPEAGNTFLFVYVSVVNTGEKAVYAPSAKQFLVVSDDVSYIYTPVPGSDVVIDKVSGTQYDYQIGRGGSVGYVLPGESNKAEGYLIYEVPASVSPAKTYVVSNLDYQTQAEWKLG